MSIKLYYAAIYYLLPAFSFILANPAYSQQLPAEKNLARPDNVSILKKTILAFCLIPIASVFLDSGAIASVVKTDVQQTLVNKLKVSKSQTPLSEVRQLNELKQIITNAAPLLVQQPNTVAVVEVTQVKINQTKTGIEVILETPQSSALKPQIKTKGNKLTADIPNAQLRLPNGEIFRQSKPAAGITEIVVTNVGEKNIQLTVTGETGVPTVELSDSPLEGLVFGVSATAATAQSNTQTTPKPANQEEQKPIELEVIGTPEGSYRVPRTSVGTKTPTDLRDIPQSIQIIPRAVIKDQGAINPGDVLNNIGIVSDNFANRTANLQRSIRGLPSPGLNNAVLRNGLKDNIEPLALTSSLANIEQIEVLRGPASVLYGQGSPGGSINIITKQPLSDPYYAAQFQIGSYRFYQPSIDFSGPLTGDGKVSYRLNAEYRNSGSFIDFLNSERFFVAPVISLQFGQNTKLTLEGDYRHFDQTLFDQGIPARGTVLPNQNGEIPRSRYIGEPTLENTERDLGRVGYRFEHRFSDNWSLRNAFVFGFGRFLNEKEVIPGALQSDNRTLTRIFVEWNRPRVTNQYVVDTNVVGKFKTGSFSHQLLTGVDFLRYRDRNIFRQGNISPIDIFNPVYGRFSFLSTPTQSDSGLLFDQIGLYLQNQIAFTDNLKLVIGGRFDFVNRKNTNFISKVITEQSDSAFSPRVGIIYQPTKTVSLYANYSRSFDQTIGTDAQGNSFKPSRGTQYEVGVKTDLFDNKLSGTLALFDITRTNLTTPDPNNRLFNIQTGEQRSRGVELFVTGELTPGWNIIASYSYTDPRITEDRRFPVGNLLSNAPEHTASLWTTYTISKGNLQGLGFGLGIFYIGDRKGDLANTFSLPSYVRTDAAIYYRQNKFQVGLNLKNLFDILYYETANGQILHLLF